MAALIPPPPPAPGSALHTARGPRQPSPSEGRCRLRRAVGLVDVSPLPWHVCVVAEPARPSSCHLVV